MALIKDDELSAFLGLSSEPSERENEIIENLATEISAVVKSYCDREIEETIYTDEILDGRGTPELILKNYPVISITSFVYLYSDDTETEVDTDDYRLDKNRGILRHRSSSWSEGRMNFQITYIAGYAAASIPGDIKLACKIWAKTIFDKARKDLFAASSSEFGDNVIQVERSKVPLEVEQLLQPYRRIFG